MRETLLGERDPPMRCVAYVRVSAKEQDEDIQRKAIEDFAPRRGIEILKWYVDKGESGAKPFSERPGASALLGELSSNGAECVVAWSIDRLGRSMLDTMNVVLDLEKRNIRVITVKEEFLQTLDPNIRKLILSILAWVAEYERRRIRERQEEAWRQGKTKGRPRKLSDEEIIKYYKTYVIERGISIRDTWKIMRSDGRNISYTRLKQRISALRKQGRIPPRKKTN